MDSPRVGSTFRSSELISSAQVLSSGNTTYNGTYAVTIYINKARNSNAVRAFVLPQTEAITAQIETKFAIRQGARLGSSGLNTASRFTNVPLALVNPVA
ncbi:hypothetical protein BJ322DRAFT_838697 [Thelephora terrestris]|uniref:Uncharacterized protein n=1 Tax=Thelephora terrestris TaxID=56493 RepID=A0A9P6HFC1_9AGAM|nr:hypothetical protein BJ322DRAFT_838697 [Thelephora terrestris]